MTLDEIRKLTHLELEVKIAEAHGFTGVRIEDVADVAAGNIPWETAKVTGVCFDGQRDEVVRWARCLDDAMALVPQNQHDGDTDDFNDALMEITGGQTYPLAWDIWATDSVAVPGKARALCEAYLLWKGGA